MNAWKQVWGSLEIPWGTQIGRLENVTQKVLIKNYWKADRVRLRFSNLYGAQPLEIEHVTVGRWDREQKCVVQTVPVTVDGRMQIRIEPGAAFDSDAAMVQLSPDSDIVIACYFKQAQECCSICQTWSAGTFCTAFSDGDQTTGELLGQRLTAQVFTGLSPDAATCCAAAGVSGLSMFTDADLKTIACFGDSITHMGYYFDPLAELVQQHFPGRYVLLNYGIGGNRLLYDDCFVPEIPGHGKCFGKAGITRFARDVYQQGAPDAVFVMEGVNDCTHAFAFGLPDEVPTGETLFKGLCDIISTVHQNAGKVYISTVMPFGCYQESFRSRANEIRCSFNRYIREQNTIADGFVDLDALMRKEDAPDILRDGCHLGDGVHPNETGGRIIAQAVFDCMFGRK